MKPCIACEVMLPMEAKFCFNCGVPQPANEEKTIRYRIDRFGDVKQQLLDHFFQAFKERIDAEHHPNQYSEYSELLYRSGFRETVHLRSEQLAHSLKNSQYNDQQVNQIIEERLEGLLDYFIIHFCKSLNSFFLPEAILKYENRKLSEIDLFQLIMDYLDFSNEKEVYYTDFLVMPPKKIKNASKHFLFPAKNERIFFISDQSMLGSGKDGFAMTEKALYWKNQLHKAGIVHYNKIDTVKREKDWLSINGMFFNANPALNLKMMKLLKKLKRLYAV